MKDFEGWVLDGKIYVEEGMDIDELIMHMDANGEDTTMLKALRESIVAQLERQEARKNLAEDP